MNNFQLRLYNILADILIELATALNQVGNKILVISGWTISTANRLNEKVRRELENS